GDEVISGCVSITGLLKIRTTKPFGESTVSKILDLVENSGMKKARSEAFITKFAKVYTPAVCYSALALAILPPLALSIFGREANWTEWIIRALTFLVISCPCALVISVPMTFFGGIGAASSKGILIKGSNYLEAMARTKIAVFDKTGTLTKGVFEVTDICPADGVSSDELLKLAAYGENFSDHPISLSLKAKYGENIDSTKVTDVENIPGKGISARVFGEKILIGNASLMVERGIDIKACTETGTVVYVAKESGFLGYILIRDVIKNGAKKALAELKKAGVRSNIMLTGDNDRTAKAVAEELGLDGYKAGLLPGDKVEEVERLLHEKGDKNVLAFVGDGINDAPVLARADLGVAMGALGSDAAIEAADIVLMDDDPGKLSLGMKISSKCLRICYENIVFAIAIKLLCLVLGALGIANMWLAIFADVGVMILAVLNAMRCLTIRENR
ncbi:MAG: cadmium-translocating P-type ATPase, partial [Lachnospiraceae bacterium]|nr:cadmium-translocating P-type ATPase [Lachnospiraceae bacterium]